MITGRITGIGVAAKALSQGKVIAVPTDTVYGLAVDPAKLGAKEALFHLKGRPNEVALVVMVHDLDAALLLTDPSQHTALRRVGARWWPGALTAVVRRNPSFDVDLGGDRATIGLRVSASSLLRDLCALTGPLGVSSANRHGQAPCETVEQLSGVFGDDFPVVDGGRCAGMVSTVVDLAHDGPRILRTGEISLAMINKSLTD
jgi:tRNA threonylcarbamoyl adenosine modification protein (Sua5/YciO/YrdC/YwlC family)